MSYKLNVDPALIHIEVFGDIVIADLAGIAKDLKEIESRVDVLPNRLLDISRAAEIQFGFPAVQSFTNDRNAIALKNNIRVAICAPNEVSYGVARMFQTLSNNPGVELRIFKDLNDARAWALTGICKEAPEDR